MYNYHSDKPELLAPVGNRESLYAAVQNGCDAVYLGGKAFNARENAQNFTVDELKEVFNYAHIRGVKVYVTVNTLYKDDEVRDVLKFIEKIYNYGVDAVIVQDLGVARLINEAFPDLELHGSTQMTIHNLEGAKYLEDLGFSRVILARELSLDEIKKIIKGTKLEVETFVHGALCVCYSGQCLMSSLIGGRSGNRGRCAQPCRLPYTLVELEDEVVVGKEYTNSHLLSPKDINTLEILPNLIDVGIRSLKVEGRMKRPEYTALVIKNYRKYIDNYLQNRQQSYGVSEKDKEDIKQIFNRGGFIPGYYLGKEDLDLISYERPKNWGIKVGEVINYDHRSKECKIKLSTELNSGDGIEIWTEDGRNPGLTLSNFELLSEDIITINVRGRIKVGDLVYRTSDKELLSGLQKSYEQPDTMKKIEIYGQLIANLGDPMQLNIWEQEGHYVSVTSEFIPEEARKQPITEEDFREQLNKLGNTPYQFGNLELDVDYNLFVPISKINELRRKAIEKLNQKRSKQFIVNSRNNSLQEEYFELKDAKREDKCKLTVYLKELDYLNDLLRLGVDRIYCDSKGLNIDDNIDDIERLAQKFINYDTELFIKLPQIARQDEMKEVKEKISKLEASNVDGYLVSQLGVAQLLKGTGKELIVDYSVNNFNSYMVKHWQQEGYQGVVLSPELNLKEIKSLTQYNEIDKELIVYGHLPMMVTEYCPIGSVATDFDINKDCNRECLENDYGLLDRKGMVAPIETDPRTCSTFIYNSQTLYLVDYLTEITEAGCQSYRLDFTFEDREEVIEIISAYQAKINNEDFDFNELKAKMRRKDYTTGHFYRGVK
ncbi:putative protease [Candidatus Frackibacter sp. WG12]|uniref:DUF3656 domain-containing U32 family peptidase n=1 Tax=unclassified Candidatus Frackibacter TaxID=2648818 RepID=UPI00088989D1|nr:MULTISPECIES: U32 family peptidase [unclassified Candidatus Frackibacter]SDC48134.1 putative protease [Candidatus Frackibacter sp. WG11]SEM95441.1 putative protease [Candidatus Frackibacter sp. WG12]